jgi:hypothetical protein
MGKRRFRGIFVPDRINIMPREPKPSTDSVSELAEKKPSEERSYYYDDAHGYEDFDPETEPEEDEECEDEATS